MDQSTIDRAVEIATKSALLGNPVERILWIPPPTASSDPNGAFAISFYQFQSAAITPPWEK